MKKMVALSFALFVAVVLAGPALAGDGNVPQSTLNTLGLSGMETLSDAEGMEIRGKSGNA